MSEEKKLFEKGDPLDRSRIKHELIFEGNLLDTKDGYIFGFGYSELAEERYCIKIENTKVYEEIISYKLTKVMEDAIRIDFNIDFYMDENFKKFYLSHIIIVNRHLRTEAISTSSSYDLSKFPPEEFLEHLLDRMTSKDSKYTIYFHFYLRLDIWKNMWTPKEHLNEFCRNISKNNLHFPIQESKYFTTEEDLDADTNYGQVLILAEGYDCDSSPLNVYINKCLDIFIKAHNEVIEKYQNDSFAESVVQKFNFPKEVKTACQQYLLYFTEFLQDIGIEAISSIKDEDGDIVLLVEPQNKEDALEKIADLLKIYLYLPNSPVANSYPNPLDSNLAVQRLSAQIQHLNSQLILATATVQQQSLTIERQNTLINQQNQLIQNLQFTPKILIDSMKNEESEKNEEPLIGGLVKVKDYELGPLSLSLPQLLKWLKEKFKSKEIH